MGVSGTGKTSVGEKIATELGAPFIEGDQHHPKSNIDKMAAGIPLTDEDRMPWLQTLAGLLAEHAGEDEHAVLACSSLRRSYRDVLRDAVPDRRVFFLHLDASFEVLERRMAHRRRHFMPASLLRSQLDTLEPLEADELGTVVDVAAPLTAVVERSVAAIRDACDGGAAGR
jgi:gluconokinase